MHDDHAPLDPMDAEDGWLEPLMGQAATFACLQSPALRRSSKTLPRPPSSDNLLARTIDVTFGKIDYCIGCGTLALTKTLRAYEYDPDFIAYVSHATVSAKTVGGLLRTWFAVGILDEDWWYKVISQGDGGYTEKFAVVCLLGNYAYFEYTANRKLFLSGMIVAPCGTTHAPVAFQQSRFPSIGLATVERYCACLHLIRRLPLPKSSQPVYCDLGCVHTVLEQFISRVRRTNDAVFALRTLFVATINDTPISLPDALPESFFAKWSDLGHSLYDDEFDVEPPSLGESGAVLNDALGAMRAATEVLKTFSVETPKRTGPVPVVGRGKSPYRHKPSEPVAAAPPPPPPPPLSLQELLSVYPECRYETGTANDDDVPAEDPEETSTLTQFFAEVDAAGFAKPKPVARKGNKGLSSHSPKSTAAATATTTASENHRCTICGGDYKRKHWHGTCSHCNGTCQRYRDGRPPTFNTVESVPFTTFLKCYLGPRFTHAVLREVIASIVAAGKTKNICQENCFVCRTGTKTCLSCLELGDERVPYCNFFIGMTRASSKVRVVNLCSQLCYSITALDPMPDIAQRARDLESTTALSRTRERLYFAHASLHPAVIASNTSHILSLPLKAAL